MEGVTLVLVLVVVLAACLYNKRRHNFWKAQGVPTPPFIPFFGHLLHFFRKPRHHYNDEIYHEHGGSTFCGLYEMGHPVLFVGDPELVKHLAIKDFDHFTDRRQVSLDESSLMTIMLANLQGESWKSIRAFISPAFTSGRMKGMFPLVCDKADGLVTFCLKQTAAEPYIDMKFNYGRYTLDTIASCAFGIECNSLINKEAIFTQHAESFFSPNIKLLFDFIFISFFPNVAKKLGIQIKRTELEFFEAVASRTLEARKAGEKRGDFLDLLRETPPASSFKKALEDRVITAQCAMFLIAGYDTTASALALLTHNLALHQHVQVRLREELQDIVDTHGDITYQAIMEAKYLDACFNETLRLYPPGIMGERACTKDYKLPGTDVTIPKGAYISFPIWSLHHDPRYWEEPELFNPDRFMPENKANIHNYTFMPFGLGPRNCIAMRFAQMEVKVGIAKMVLAANIDLAPGMGEVQVELTPLVLRPKGQVNIVLTPLQENL